MYRRRRVRRSGLRRRVNNLYKMIETKSSVFAGSYSLSHNLPQQMFGNFLATTQGTGEGYITTGNRIGQTVRPIGVKFKFNLENPMGRPRVYYKFMLVRVPTGSTTDRSTLFRGIVGNKLMDMFNNDAFKLLWQRVFLVTDQGFGGATTFGGAGAANPLAGSTLGAQTGGIGARYVKVWIPGRKFMNVRGALKYQPNGSQSLATYDYKMFCLAYDWSGTLQDANIVGYIQSAYSIFYYKDA